MTSIKKYLHAKISNWYTNAKLDYNVNGYFIDAITTGDELRIIWEEEGTRYAMVFPFYRVFTPAEIYNIWMGSDWEEETA